MFSFHETLFDNPRKGPEASAIKMSKRHSYGFPRTASQASEDF